ncbi:sigma-70 family RNA polymerase sigma factor [Streptomyces humicola]|uniref:sigma-70 family RNA polymerase sigma factor n=1 Tax=Streptomyces humicola TaxID=2953240 RepID=UPI00210E3FFD|nr:sigma-70 family RNA polymerase sigma factor [Streptomyces humicola]
MHGEANGSPPCRRPGDHDRADHDRADDEALRSLYAAHAASLFRYVLPMTRGDHQRAEDVVQETMLRAWRTPSVLDPSEGSALGWLRTVARNLVIDQERMRRARPAEVGEEPLMLHPSSTPGPDEALARTLLSWQLAEALATLTADHRAVLLELYYRERSVAEAAEALGIPQGTVKSRAYYAVRALRLVCQERGLTR